MGTAASAREATKGVAAAPAMVDEEAEEQRGALEVADALGAADDDAEAEVAAARGAADGDAVVGDAADSDAADGDAAMQEPAPMGPAPPEPVILEIVFEREDGTRLAKRFHAKPLGIEVSDTKMPASICKVRPGSIAERSGVQAGWKMLEISKEDVTEKPQTSWREVVLAAAALPPVRDLPLQVFAHMNEDSIAFVCTTLGGEEVGNISGLRSEDVGSALADLIRELVPAPPVAQWKIVLPTGKCLENDELTLPLQELFDLDTATCGGAAVAAAEEWRAEEPAPPETSILSMVFEREDGTRVVAKALGIEFRERPLAGISEVHPGSIAEKSGVQAEWKLVEVNKQDVTEKPPTSLRELLVSAAAALPQAS